MIKPALIRFLALSLVLSPAPRLVLAKPAQQQAISDDLINDNVKRKLAGDLVVKGGGLKIDVTQGVVTLAGAVDSEKRKARAEKLTRKVKGVTSVVNQIQVIVK